MSAHTIASVAAATLVSLPVSSAHAQSVVSACSGVSLPRSVVTDIAGQVLVPVITPLQNILGTLTLGTVNLGLAGSLANAAAGNPIKLNVLDVNGNAVDIATNPTCVTQSDAFELETPAGIAFGGNQITGLGTAGRLAIARETNAIAIGDAARTGLGARGAVAIGDAAAVTHVSALGSVALGQNSLATGATLGNQAYLIGGTAPAEVNIGGRRLTGVAGGAADGDAVNVAQLRAAALAVAGDSLMFDSTLGAYSGLRGGVTQRITNVTAGVLGVGSTDAVNGAQLGATNDAVAGNTASITTLGGSVTTLNTSVSALQSDALLYDGTLGAYSGLRGGVTQRITNIAAGTLGAGSTDAVNGAQLGATNDAVAGNTASITTLGGSVTTLNTSVSALQSDALLYDGTLGAYSGLRGGVTQRITNIAAGTLGAGSTDAVNGAQLSATNDAVAGNTASITMLGGSVTTLNNNVSALQSDALLYDGTLAAYTAGRGGVTQRITNVTAGTLGAGSTDAVNGAQLGATNDTVAGITNNIATFTTNIAALQDNALLYDSTLTAFNASRGGAAQRITNIAAGTLGAGSTDAVNGAQLGATNDAVAGNTVNITNITTSVAGLRADAMLYDGTLSAYNAARGGMTQRITNIAAGVLGAGSTDAVNGAQLGATNDTVAGITTNIATFTTNIAALQDNALLYDASLQAFNASRGGTTQRITNIAAGVLGAGSFDAVNGSQLYGMGDSLASALGGSSIYNPATGLVTAGIVYAGTTYNSVQGAVSAIETTIGGTANGTNQRYFKANSTMADSQATGSDSTAVGPNAIASADGAIAAGRNTTAGSAGSVAIGDGSSTMAGKAVAIGSENIASGDGAVAIGDPNIAMGDGAVALGKDNQATGIGAVGLGDTNFATGNGAVALGQTNQATGAGAIAIGGTNIVNGANAVAVGSGNVVTGVEALAFGVRNQAVGDGSLAIGTNIVTSGGDTLAVGNQTVATGESASAFGNRAAASGGDSTALGTTSVASRRFALAVGQNATASGYASTAIGTGAVVTGLGSVAIGTGSSATQDGSVALGGAASTTRGGVTGYTAFGVAALQTSIGEVAIARTIRYQDPTTGALQTAGQRQITGLASGSEDTDAVNVAQLRGVSNSLGSAFAAGFGGGAIYNATTGALTGPAYFINGVTYNSVGAALTAVGGQVGSVAANSVSYDTGARDRVTLGGTAGTTVTNMAAGTLAAGSTDAVNGGQLFATNQQVAANTSAITTLSNNIVGSTLTPVQYSSSRTPTTSNGGVVTNDVTLVGANAAAPVALHNVADGAVGTGSTDAVNGRQLNAVTQTAQVAQTTANEAVALGRNSVQYDSGGASVSLGSAGTVPVSLRNVAAGTSATDAANFGQLSAGVDRAISSANAYTDSRLGELSYDLRNAKRDASGGTAAAMALATIPQAYGPGMSMAGMGLSTWRGESAIAFGISKASADGRIVVKAGATFTTRGQGGAAGGVGFGF